MTDTPKVSIIIPVYNAEKYLDECLESILDQSYPDWEAILIDDGSTDSSHDICKKYSSSDVRFHYFSQNNSGPGKARNKGMALSSGDYLTFVDADDYIAPDYLKTLVYISTKYNTDVTCCGYITMNPANNRQIRCDHRFVISDENDPKKSINQLVFKNICCKLYLSDIAKSVDFSNKKLGEDMEYTEKVLARCKNAAHIGYGLYCYRAYRDSLSRTMNPQKKMQHINTTINKQRNEASPETINGLLCDIEHTVDLIIHAGEEPLYHTFLNQLSQIPDRVSALPHSQELSDRVSEKISTAARNSKLPFFKLVYKKARHTAHIICGRWKELTHYHWNKFPAFNTIKETIDASTNI